MRRRRQGMFEISDEFALCADMSPGERPRPECFEDHDPAHLAARAETSPKNRPAGADGRVPLLGAGAALLLVVIAVAAESVMDRGASPITRAARPIAAPAGASAARTAPRRSQGHQESAPAQKRRVKRTAPKQTAAPTFTHVDRVSNGSSDPHRVQNHPSPAQGGHEFSFER